jgi:hypothetical protein
MNKHLHMHYRVLGYVFGTVAEFLNKFIYAVLPVKELPNVDAGGVQAKTTETNRGIRVKQNGPVVKLLPEHDEGVSYGFVILFVSHILSCA